MSNEKKIAMLEEIMDLDEGSLSIDSVLSDYEEWDSLSKLSLVVEIKKNWGIVLTTEIIRNFRTVKDICDIIK